MPGWRTITSVVRTPCVSCSSLVCLAAVVHLSEKANKSQRKWTCQKFVAAALRPCFLYCSLAVLFTTPWGCCTKRRNLSSQIGAGLLQGWCETGFKHHFLANLQQSYDPWLTSEFGPTMDWGVLSCPWPIEKIVYLPENYLKMLALRWAIVALWATCSIVLWWHRFSIFYSQWNNLII